MNMESCLQNLFNLIYLLKTELTIIVWNIVDKKTEFNTFVRNQTRDGREITEKSDENTSEGLSEETGILLNIATNEIFYRTFLSLESNAEMSITGDVIIKRSLLNG